MKKGKMWVVNLLLTFGLIGLLITVWDKIEGYFTENPVGVIVAIIIFFGGLHIIKRLFSRK